MFTEQPLTIYSKDHRPKSVCLIRCLDGSGEVHCVHEWPNGDRMHTATVIQVYHRYRDGRRALKALGYTEEGRFWRQVPKQKQESGVSIEELAGEGL